MKPIRSLLLGAALVLSSPFASLAQQLSLEQLQKLGALPSGLPLQRMTAALFTPEWTYRGVITKTQETYWTAGDTLDNGAEPEEVYESSVSLRPMPGGIVDVLFRTTSARYFEPLHRALKREKLTSTPVTCLECEGVRYETAAYSITLYSGKKGAYPFVAVLHPAAPPVPLLPAASENVVPATGQ
ncbi:hypothetical protein ACFPAF_16430 [Hymenobacter endophyticus]|uniref:Uncharacterized protein n=1 Tax=Hymenobacter endophyticus TaxID=3076335 RepID=A0ABU3TKW7_9BACT|nr:hypothetical protein [Hymenobacter endophyticus]MDU0371990.1 hypothetical protein [Hymenobacter endophyticus]